MSFATVHFSSRRIHLSPLSKLCTFSGRETQKLRHILSKNLRTCASGDMSQERQYSNRLAKEQSPYLLQHANNPVEWFPWGEEAFNKARIEDKAIFLSVGYSTCHWCHVMETESFENKDVAEILNQNFISIKVDREERPDVDKVYMTYVQATQGGGGWPMSVFLTPTLKPFFGGTYFPPEDKYGRIGFKTLLRRVSSVWETKKEELEQGGEEAIQQLRESSQLKSTVDTIESSFAETAVDLCIKQLMERFDPQNGGFGSAPKFPRPCEISVIFHRHKRALPGFKVDQLEGGQAAGDPLLAAMVSLKRMAMGGMHDHVGGGFHRYSVDDLWHVPHFEKMLYDQGQLANAYLDAFAITEAPYYSHVAMDVLDYLRRDMCHSEGGFFSAEDADSLDAHGNKKEGAFFVWTKEEVDTVLGPENSPLFCHHFTVRPEGNCTLSPKSDPHGEFLGKNVLIQRASLQETARKFHKTEEEAADIIADSCRALHSAREDRPRPHLDDKIIVAWNGLTISAMARASLLLRSFPSQRKLRFPVHSSPPGKYLESAVRAAEFIRGRMYLPESGKLLRSFREGPSRTQGFLEDYAFLVAGLLDLFQAGGDASWLHWAVQLQDSQVELFFDTVDGAFYNVAEGDASIVLRMKEDYDGAEPSGNSVSAANLVRFSLLFEGTPAGERYAQLADRTMAAFSARLSTLPMALPLMCTSLGCQLSTAPSSSAPAQHSQVIISGEAGDDGRAALAAAAMASLTTQTTIIQIDPSSETDAAFWSEFNPRVLKMAESRDGAGKSLAFVCQNFACLAPTDDPVKLRNILEGSATVSPQTTSVDIKNLLKKK